MRKKSGNGKFSRGRGGLHVESLENRVLLAGDLVAHWRAEDLLALQADNTPVRQWTDGVSGIAAVGQGSPDLQGGQLGGRAVIRFDPADGYDQLLVDRLDSPMAGRGDFSIAVVFATDAPTLVGGQGNWYENTTLVDGSALGFSNDWGISINASGQLAAGLGFGQAFASHTLYTPQAGWDDGEWHAVVFQRQGDVLRLQADDSPPVELKGHANPLSGLHLSLGSQKFGDLPLDGTIADVRIYDGALDATELNRLLDTLRLYYDNQAPQARADEYSFAEDTSAFFQPAEGGVLDNDTDAEGDPLTARLVEGPQHGSVSLQADGSFLYATPRDYFGTDQFTYVAQDFRASEPATVTLRITPTYDPAVPVADVYKAVPSEPLVVAAADGVLENDQNPDRAELTVVLDQDVSSGALTLRPDGSFVYDAQGFAGVTTFSYRIADGTGLSVNGNVTLIVNTPPRARDDQYDVNEDSLLVIDAALGVLQNDQDPDVDALSVTLVEGPEHGTLALDPSGSFVYTADKDYFGADRFTYQVGDGTDVSNVATARINVQAVNDLPITEADGYVGLPNEAIRVSADRGVLANDRDVDAVRLTAQLILSPTHGALQLNPDGSFEYVPEAGFVGEDTFSYRANDELADSAVTRVTLTVTRTPLMISEFMAINASSLPTRIALTPGDELTRETMTPDWIEISNLVGQPVDLSDMYLTDDRDLPQKWAFPEGAVIPAEGTLIVYASGFDIVDPSQDQDGRWHTNFTLDREGGYLGLYVGKDTLLSEFVDYPRQRVDVSYGLADGQPRYFPTPSPAGPNSAGIERIVDDTVFSVDRGFFTEPFVVEITTETPGATLVYTTDGSDPTLEHGTLVPPVGADVSPLATVPIEGTTTLRAAAFREGWLPTNIDTQTYLFTRDIVQQRTLSSTVVDDPEWGPQLEASLLALPTISLVTDGRISLTETGTSVELIFPDGAEGFQIDSGIEQYGGHSLNSPKKNMRLSFKSKYGDPSLRYDLFGEGAVDEFQQLLLRTGSHDTFFWTHPSGGRGNYIRNRWAFDRQLEMGQPAPHGRYVHVYINGSYAGMHHLMERPNADFMASYLGGYDFQYDALNAGTPVDGTLDAWNAMQTNEVIDDYQQLQQYLDVDNYADYMLLQFYAGNDWDWNTNQNWMAARKREEGAGYVFFSWDSDVMLRSSAEANVINRGGPANLWSIRGGVRQHEDFRMLMADRALRYFFDGGMLSDERLRADMTALADQIRLPIIAESARWGGRTYTPRIWESAVQWVLNRYAPEGPGGRAETVIAQLRRANVYPSIEAPEFWLNDARQNGGHWMSGDRLTVKADAGVVYYTLDGSDPRLPGGGLNPEALRADESPIPLEATATLRARALQGDEWSALREVLFRVNTVPADATNLRIAEVHYHPADPTDEERAAGFRDADDFEFIEIVNISSSNVDLTDVRFVATMIEGVAEGVEFDFATSVIRELAPGGRAVVVEDTAAFTQRYGQQVPVAGQWSGGLSNRAETIALQASGNTLVQFRYSDQWYPATDGEGASLQATDESAVDLAAWGQPGGWRPSSRVNGSPGRADGQVSLPGDANRDGLFNSSDLVLVFSAGLYEDPRGGDATWEQGDWDGDGKFTTADLVLAFVDGRYTVAASPRQALRDLSWSSGRCIDICLERSQRPLATLADATDPRDDDVTQPKHRPLSDQLAAELVDALWAEE